MAKKKGKKKGTVNKSDPHDKAIAVSLHQSNTKMKWSF